MSAARRPQLATVRPGVDLAVELVGAADGPLAVLVSGAGAPAAFWPDGFLERLAAAGFTVARFDHRDTGYSTHFDEPYPIGELLLDLEALVAHLDRPSLHLVGHSMGGYLVQMAACATWPGLASITSISAGSAVDAATRDRLGSSSPTDAVWTELMKNQPTGDFEHDLAGWLASFRFLNGSRHFDEARATAYIRSLYQGDPRNAQVAVNHVHAMGTVPPSLAESLPDVCVPTLVLHGLDDPLVPIDNGRATARLVHHSTFGALAGAGHMFFDPETWREIGDWVETHLTKSHETASASP